MSYGLLLTLVIWAGVIALLLRPPRRPLLLARAVYYLSVALNELPMLVLLLLALNLAPSLLPSDDGPALGPLAAAAGITLGLFVLLGLVLIQRRISRSRAVILRILGRPEGAHPFRWAWLAPLPLRPREVERVPGLAYGPGGREHRLDLYRRRDHEADSPAPVLLYFHGGGYSTGSRHFEIGRAHV